MAGFSCWALLLLTMLPFIAVSGRPIPGTFLNSRLYLYSAIILKGSHISVHVVLLFRAACPTAGQRRQNSMVFIKLKGNFDVSEVINLRTTSER